MMLLSTRRVLRATALLVASTLAATGAFGQAEKPQYGGTLNIGPHHVTQSPLSGDAADWTWKFNQDTGLTTETLFSADLSKSVGRGGKHRFISDAWLPSDAIRGELAESWKWSDKPLRVDIQLRKGVMFPAKAGVMAARELVADDVVYSYNRYEKSPKKIPTYYDHIEKVEATDKHSVRFTF